ncbi:hypothetical protein GCM10009811_01270 [Nostocoides veronense]|uniref:Uncharacterized protein n=1 Tax=Nostocoides veronense TaxID=330836 RepID=A0ABN2LA27_9MICO
MATGCILALGAAALVALASRATTYLVVAAHTVAGCAVAGFAYAGPAGNAGLIPRAVLLLLPGACLAYAVTLWERPRAVVEANVIDPASWRIAKRSSRVLPVAALLAVLMLTSFRQGHSTWLSLAAGLYLFASVMFAGFIVPFIMRALGFFGGALATDMKESDDYLDRQVREGMADERRRSDQAAADRAEGRRRTAGYEAQRRSSGQE